MSGSLAGVLEMLDSYVSQYQTSLCGVARSLQPAARADTDQERANMAMYQNGDDAPAKSLSTGERQDRGAGIQNANEAQVLSELDVAEAAYQAALETIANIVQPSLVRFIS